MADILDRQSAEDRSVFIEDTFKEGYAVLGVEGEILRLRDSSSPIVTHEMEVSSWRRIVDKHLLEPFPVGDMKKRFRRGHYQSRGSEFHRQCPLSLLYVLLDQSKIPGLPSPSSLAVAGLVRHHIATDDCAHNISIENKIQRREYCECDVEYTLDVNKIDEEGLCIFLDGQRKSMPDFRLDPSMLDIGELVLRGRADCLLRAGPYIVVLDFKRGGYGFYEKKSNKLQFGSYALAVEQLLQEKFSGRILISLNRVRDSSPGAFRLPKEHMTMMENGSGLEELIGFNMVLNYLMRKELLDDPGFYISTQEHYTHAEVKRKSGLANKCATLISGSPCFYIENGLCGIVRRYVEDGKDLRQLLLPSVKI